MRHQSPIVASLFMFLALFTANTGDAQDPTSISECSTVATFKYKSTFNNKPICKITLDRANVGSQLPVTVPPNSHVLIVIDHQQPDEIIEPIVTDDAAPKLDPTGDIISKMTSPLASLLFSPPLIGAHIVGPIDMSEKAQIARAQDALFTQMKVWYGAYNEPLCLQLYVGYDQAAGVCTQTRLADADAFDDAKDQAISDITDTLNAKLPSTDVTALNSQVGAFCAVPGVDQNDCNGLQANQAKLQAMLDTLTAKAALATNPLITTKNTLILLTDRDATILAPYTRGKDRKLTIKVNAVEQIGGTITQVASLTVNWQQTNWGLSTGVVVSTLKNKTFQNSPIYNANGTPSTDPTGKTYTQVTVSKTYPGIISPVFLANWRYHTFQGDQGKVSALLSGGLGANIVSKSADFAVGPSIQWGQIVFSGVLHYGRQTQLTGGVHVGDQFGTSPPNPPTVNSYKPAFGFGITYRLPIT